ncbi:Melatonin receptor type 1C [Mizuhopecten yessoensis]|uniref:Melatonin receptor type 1C n=1 Tax=Mizuhopecten yessoensis TaxID=6573 RepID=A0A210PPD5_MIZYE|nr:Melatonin receptor type 1C [Mizuhopecten yessoensis]
MRMELNNCASPNSTTSGSDDVCDTAPLWIVICVVTVSTATILMNIPALLVVMFTKIKSSNFRNLHFLSLSITDTMVAVCMIPILWTFMFPANRMTYWQCNGRFMCFGISYINSMSQVTSICVDRLLLLMKPSLRYTANYGRRMFGIILLTLFITSGITITPFVVFATPQDEIICELDNLFTVNIGYFCLYIGVVLWSLQIMIVGCCLSMVGILQTRRLYRGRYDPGMAMTRVSTVNTVPSTSSVKEDQLTLEMRGIITISIIVSLYTVCVTPMHLGFLLQGLSLLRKVDRTTRHVFIVLGCLNSAINPIIYCFRIDEMKTLIKERTEKVASFFRSIRIG